jgi:ethanolamine transporter EutH
MGLIPTPPSTGVPTAARIRAARAIAMLADLAEIVVFPAFMEGFLSPANDVLDVAVAVALTWLLGWHWAFLPSFLAEMIPVVGLVPTWTAAVFYVTSGLAPAAEVPTATRVDPPPPPPALKG